MKKAFVFSLVILSVAAHPAAQPKDLARERVELLFRDVPVAQVFPALAKSLGYELSLDPALRALVTIEVKNVTAATALNAICESIGCRWRLEGTRLVVGARTDVVTTLRSTPTGDDFQRRGGNVMNYAIHSLDEELPFEITWSPVDIYAAFFMLARMTDADVDLAPALRDTKLAVTIKRGSLRSAFDSVCAVGGCRWELVVQPKRTVRVTERNEGEPRSTGSSSIRVYESADAGVTPPVAVTMPKPQYTAGAMHEKIQGRVKVACVVLADGSVGEATIIESLDRVYGLDEEALKAVRTWHFKPGTKDGRPVVVRTEIELTFALR
jgi:TonB family protein